MFSGLGSGALFRPVAPWPHGDDDSDNYLVSRRIGNLGQLLYWWDEGATLCGLVNFSDRQLLICLIREAISGGLNAG